MDRKNSVGLLGDTFPILLWERYGHTTPFTQPRSYIISACISHAGAIIITEEPITLVKRPEHNAQLKNFPFTPLYQVVSSLVFFAL